MSLLSLIKSRHELAKKFTKDFQSEVKQNLKDYKAEDSWLNSFADNNKLYVNVTKRYEIIIPMIFTTHEGMLSSMFDRIPDLIIDQGGKDDEQKATNIRAAYEYLQQKLDLESFMNTSAWWYLLTGFVSAHAGYVQKTSEVPATDEMGEVILGEDGEPMMVTVYEDDDPEVYVDDPQHVFWSPESKYSIQADKVPFYTREKLMTVEDVFRTYGAVVEPDSSIKDFKKGDDNKTDIIEEDLERVKVILYYGNIPGKYEPDLEEKGLEYDPDGWYYVVSTRSQVLHAERTPDDMRTCSVLKWYGVPTEFFGFGIAKLLRPFQKEKSLRRTQQARYADIASFPKLLVKNDGDTDIDEIAYSDPRELPVLLYDGDTRPEYLVPPDLSNVLTIGEQKADEDAQKASGMLDMSNPQSSTVDTATGQVIFAEASEKRIRYAKANFMRFYRDVVIKLLKLCQLYWSEDKLITITDEHGDNIEITLTKDSLAEIDFDTDIRIDPDSLTINKDVLRAQAIELYNMVKDDPIVERQEVFKDVIRDGFGKRNPDKYIKDSGVQPGTQLVDPQSGQQYTVGETGELVSQEQEAEMADPTGQGDVPMDQAGVMGAAQQL